MKVEIDKNSGFCFGVVNAIKKAEEELGSDGILYCLGDIVHNNHEVDRLKSKGLITINHEQFKELKNVKVLLRAHGEPPETYEIANKNNIEIIDATCPVVLQLQKKIKKTHTGSTDNDEQIVIFGEMGHAEVNGLVGQTANKAIVIEKTSDLSKIDLNKNIRLFSQTTKSIDEFGQIVEYINEKKDTDTSFVYYDTICRQVANRMPNLKIFASLHQLIFFVSGKKSSNGKVLFEECKKINPNTYFISDETEIVPELLNGIDSVGICGATSTPTWLMENVANKLKSFGIS